MALSRQARYNLIEVGLVIVAAISAAVLLMNLVGYKSSYVSLVVGGTLFTASLLALLRILLDPDRVRASQSNVVLSLASKTLDALSTRGLNEKSAQTICELMLPVTSAVAVAITDKESIIGYAGRASEYNKIGSPIRTHATHATIEDGSVRILRNQTDIGFPTSSTIHAAIVAPLRMGDETIGTLKFYYPSANRLSETQESVALGFAELLSTQVAAHALDEQHKVATSMELKLLQSQINPHFLFNTINTIASLIRTDPDRARELLREFAVFYRRTLEEASDIVTLQRELNQTKRYLGFEIARFGDDRLQFVESIDPDTEGCLIPAFMVQPLVENAVRHAMPSEGTLLISCTARRIGADLIVVVEDNGIGMNDTSCSQLLKGSESEGLGIAMRNIQERIRGYYGKESYMQIDSEIGKGTRITMFLKNSCAMSD